MDKLKNCVDALRVLARQSHDPNAQLLAERRINEYLQREIDDLRTSLRQISRAINTEADKRVDDEDWRLMGEYVQSCRDRVLDIFGVWYRQREPRRVPFHVQQKRTRSFPGYAPARHLKINWAGPCRAVVHSKIV